MKRSIHLRFFVSLVLVASMFAPMAAVSASAFDAGKKHFNAGMNYEVSEQWEKAVEEFALAVADSPKNAEYRLHLTRALFMASQMQFKKGSAAAKEKDYESAYISFRRAYGFDPTNELAKSEMERMVRLQQAVNDGTEADKDKKADPTKVKMVPSGYVVPPAPAAGVQVQQKLEKLRDLSFPQGIDLQQIIKDLARDLDLNVLFDKEAFRPGAPTAASKTFIDIKGVTSARALDYIFMTEGLFFQKVGPRTIIVFNTQGRQKYQQLVLRTFYLANAAPKEIVKIVQGAIPAQPGRSQTIILPDEATNSVTIRDTEENIRLIGQLIKSMDKDRAEVVMDVAFYEVNKNDFLQLGLQVGNAAQLTALGGTGAALLKLGGTALATVAGAAAGAAATQLPAAVPTGIVLPTASLAAFQTKANTKLIASTQIHAFNNEDSSARIGQRVPVQSAQFVGLGTGSNLPQNNGFGQTANVINYEQVGLTLKFKPLVFPNQDVQVALDIELKDVAGANTLTPTFTERTIKGTARIQNNKTLLLASVAQGTESDTRGGIPFLSWIPLIGRLFSAPIKDNRHVDVVIAVTPRVIRAPSILPEDEIERATGSIQTPTNSSLQDLVAEEDRQELLAAARRLPNSTTIQLPDATIAAPEYVKASTDGTQANAVTSADMTTPQALEAAIPNIKQIDTSAKTLQVTQTSNVVKPPEQPVDNAVKTLKIDPSPEDVQKPLAAEPKAAENVPKTEQGAASAVEIRLGRALPEMMAGDKIKIPVLVQGGGTFRTATIGLGFDSKKVAVRGVTFGDVYGAGLANAVVTPFLNENGKMYVTLTGKDEAGVVPAGTLAYVEIEALVDGKPAIIFDRDLFNFQTLEGKNFVVRFQE